MVFRDIDEPWCPDMVVLPARRFLMGSPEEVGYDAEHPQHEVVLTRNFALARCPATFEEYGYFCEQTGRKRPSDEGWDRGWRPVINVSWKDTQAYCAWLSQTTEQDYRLPSEAEWEYACRAGTTTPYAFGDQITNKDANFLGSQTTEVGHYPANPWGLHDMHGNIWEWIEDCWNKTYDDAPTDGSAWLQGDCSTRIVRGGSWISPPELLRSAYRNWIRSEFPTNYIGFRVARKL